ncbi:hypothetical protein HYFRA_00009186 [Hymenoscyphus fraxineus]|uniref:Uncharacterized protein n=1 Tax=Hymenoscyphus fraxineus TaxID=746836 RepID=A0A9N9PT33_9HELO|nr:hypothetical protein HYFRA_00009186 [Hymenoscyphus fraxineus]
MMGKPKRVSWADPPETPPQSPCEMQDPQQVKQIQQWSRILKASDQSTLYARFRLVYCFYDGDVAEFYGALWMLLRLSYQAGRRVKEGSMDWFVGFVAQQNKTPNEEGFRAAWEEHQQAGNQQSLWSAGLIQLSVVKDVFKEGGEGEAHGVSLTESNNRAAYRRNQE